MKPIRLSAQAFGPYLERVEIDFTKFEETGLFLIAGPTGGGKTSLLDAVCFALYCKATGGKRDFSSMRCMSAPMDLPTQVEFDFSLGGKAYRFKRSRFYKINRRTKEPQIQESHECFTLENGEAHLLDSGTETAVRRRAESLLHLSCEQFSQVAVLPQGEFLRLLRAGSQEKGEILRTLFSAEIWKSLRDAFAQRSKALEEESRRLSDLQAGLLSQAHADTPAALEKAIKEREQGIQALSREGEKTAKELEETQALLQARENHARLEQALAQAEKEWKSACLRREALEKSAPQTAEKRAQAQAAQKQALAAAQEEARLEGQLLEAKRAEEIRKKAEETRLAQQARQKEAEAFAGKLQEAQARMEKGLACEAQYRAGAERLPALVEERARLEKALSSLEELEKRQKALKKAEQARLNGEKAAGEAEAALSALAARLEEQEALRRQNAALELAQGLGEGAPCPVCGAVNHPAPAQGSGQVLDERELESLRAAEKKARAAAQEALGSLRAAEKALEEAESAWKEQSALCKGLPPQAEAARQAEETAAREQEARRGAKLLAPARVRLEELRKEREQLSSGGAQAREAVSALGAQAAELERQAAESAGKPSAADLSKQAAEKRQARKSLEETAASLLKQAEEEAAAFVRAGEAAALTKAALEKAKESLAAFPAPWEEPPVLESLRQQAEALRAKSLESAKALAREGAELKAERERLSQLAELQKKLGDLEAVYSRVAKLSRLLSGNNPRKLPVLQYVLSVTLDQVLVSANHFFAVLSRGRYALRLMEGPKGGNAYAGLDLEVLDGASMLPRSIETLSGGEQFLASLSLAFGLSDVIQSHAGAVELESIFIDEGFGSLDAETLDTAMKALSMLRSSGRLIGVISHVSELQTRIPSRIQITRDSGGFSHAQVRL